MGVCEQHRRRPACASAQSDQHLCYLLCGKYDNYVNLLQVKFQFLASLDWFETRFFGNPEDKFSRDEAHRKHSILS